VTWSIVLCSPPLRFACLFAFLSSPLLCSPSSKEQQQHHQQQLHQQQPLLCSPLLTSPVLSSPVLSSPKENIFPPYKDRVSIARQFTLRCTLTVCDSRSSLFCASDGNSQRHSDVIVLAIYRIRGVKTTTTICIHRQITIKTTTRSIG
jgi:hypothetical protein